MIFFSSFRSPFLFFRFCTQNRLIFQTFCSIDFLCRRFSGFCVFISWKASTSHQVMGSYRNDLWVWEFISWPIGLARLNEKDSNEPVWRRASWPNRIFSLQVWNSRRTTILESELKQLTHQVDELKKQLAQFNLYNNLENFDVSSSIDRYKLKAISN